MNRNLSIIIILIFSFLSNISTILAQSDIFISANVGGAKLQDLMLKNKKSPRLYLLEFLVGYDRSIDTRLALSWRNYSKDIEYSAEQIFSDRLVFLEYYHELYHNSYFGFFYNLGLGGYRTENKQNKVEFEPKNKNAIWRIAGKIGCGVDYLFDAGFHGELKYEYIKSMFFGKSMNELNYYHSHNIILGIRYNL